MMQPVIEIKKLTKDYGYGRGIFDVDLTVYKRYHFLSSDVPIYSGALSQKWEKCPKGSAGG